MNDRGLLDFISFEGSIARGDHQTSLRFRVRIAENGEVEFEFESIPIKNDTIFILREWDSDRKGLSKFSLTGLSTDGIRFSTEDLYFDSLNHSSDLSTGDSMKPAASCMTSQFHRRLARAAELPCYVMRLKGFQNFNQLTGECSLGIITMNGPSKLLHPDTLSGTIQIHAATMPADLKAWRKEVDELFEHIRRVMSFASAVVLHSPVCEYFYGQELEVSTWSQVKQSPASMRIIHFLHQTPIFLAAVNSHFSPPIKIKNLFHAIEWFTMDVTYNEVRLINAMTVLENLVASNLDDDATFITEPKEFKKTKEVLRKVIRACVEQWPSANNAAASEVVKELNERLNDLNRRSIFNKLTLLIRQWSIPLEGITEEQIKDAKKARDLIVHRGHYATDKDDELWEHVTIIRELVVRFLFTAIGYNGPYISLVGGLHHTVFPPPTSPDSNA
ncbi:hypothetical protein ACXZ1M_14245 [Duganella sp. PWIR1]